MVLASESVGPSQLHPWGEWRHCIILGRREAASTPAIGEGFMYKKALEGRFIYTYPKTQG